jgi:hypothetical protein
MSAKVITLDEFVGELREVVLEGGFRPPLYTLILGAGASRSAGIPLAWEMERVLKKLARIRKVSLSGRPDGESGLSWRFRRVLGPDRRRHDTDSGEASQHDDNYVETGRQFLLSCIRRAGREANLTHLVAAHLSSMGVFNPIVTTNFDDQALSGFWSLPWSSADTEPHVIYDPAFHDESDAQVAEGVPIIIKAHGHHTTYGMRVLDDQIDRIATGVRNLMKRMPPPLGYIVVGYSGWWNDGIMQTLSEPEDIGRKQIYWMFVGATRPTNPNIERICANNDVKFVPIVDADIAFLRLWFAIPSPFEILSSDGHTDDDLIISFRPGWRPRRAYRMPKKRVYDWFNPNLIKHDSADWNLEDPVKFENARHELLPILKRIEISDDRQLDDDCIGRLTSGSGALYRGIDALSKRVPLQLEWTRRNRRLLKFGLMTKEETGLGLRSSTFLLAKLCAVVGHFGD